MQTFLPYKSFYQSARCLDYKRLGKQRVEAMQLINTLEGKSVGWAKHPAARMWWGYHTALKVYHDYMVEEWINRGYNNTMKLYWEDEHRHVAKTITYPFWLGNLKFHASHRSNLLRKDPEYYGKFGWTEPADLEYVWPVT